MASTVLCNEMKKGIHIYIQIFRHVISFDQTSFYRLPDII